MWGRHDQALPVANADWLAEHVPAEVVILEQSGHSSMWEEPDLFNQAVGDWIANLASWLAEAWMSDVGLVEPFLRVTGTRRAGVTQKRSRLSRCRPNRPPTMKGLSESAASVARWDRVTLPAPRPASLAAGGAAPPAPRADCGGGSAGTAGTGHSYATTMTAALKPAALASQRRMAASAPRQLAGRRGRALLLQLEGAGPGRPAADQPAEGRRRRGAPKTRPCTTARHSCRRPITPVFSHPLPGEGIWSGTGPLVRGRSPVLVTTFRTETDYPRIVAYVAWFDHTRTSVAWYPGRYEPPSAPVRGPMMVPYDQRWRLLATFNGGFIYRDGSNGSSINGRSYEPLKAGLATLIGYRDGRVDVTAWHGGPAAGAQVAFARQSLPLIIDHGRLNPALNDSSQWGYTLGNAVRVWRTGRRDRPARQPDLRRRRLSDGDDARADPPAGGRRARDAARHQPGMADADHLPPPRRPRPGAGGAELPAAAKPLPGSRRPRLLRRLPASGGPGHGAAQLISDPRDACDLARRARDASLGP